jgi:hypothetical protein
MDKPEFPRPSVGDELIIVTAETRYQPERITPVRVRTVARFKVTLENLDRSDRLCNEKEFDLRDRLPWATATERKYSRAGKPRLHTTETLAYGKREYAARAYLDGSGVHSMGIRGSLRTAFNADPIGFANALRRFEGLEEL